jgi:Zn-dependent protease with chaperone function
LIVPGGLLVLIAIALRPRFPKLDPDAEPLTRDRAPTLFALIDRVADAIGAPRPHVVAVDDQFNASAGASGIRRRRVLCLGLPLLGVLRPQERVALIGHELGHFVNGDVRRGPLTRIALTTLGDLADLVRPTGLRRHGGLGLLSAISELLARLILTVLYFMAWSGQCALLWIGQRAAQRAEYLADELGARAGGSEAGTDLSDILVVSDAITTVAGREARLGKGPDAWRAAADQARAGLGPRLVGLRQLSVRDTASLFASHPPAGLRAMMVSSRAYQTPAVVLTEAESARLDTELRREYERARRSLAGG